MSRWRESFRESLDACRQRADAWIRWKGGGCRVKRGNIMLIDDGGGALEVYWSISKCNVTISDTHYVTQGQGYTVRTDIQKRYIYPTYLYDRQVDERTPQLRVISPSIGVTMLKPDTGTQRSHEPPHVALRKAMWNMLPDIPLACSCFICGRSASQCTEPLRTCKCCMITSHHACGSGCDVARCEFATEDLLPDPTWSDSMCTLCSSQFPVRFASCMGMHD